MKNLFGAGIGALSLLAMSAPASAATFVNVGDTTTVYFNGLVDAYLAGGTPVPGLTAELVLTLTGFSGQFANFEYSLENTSSAPITDSRISIFAFNVPSATVIGGTTATGDFNEIILNDDFPNVGGINRIFEVCAKAGGGPNCSSGGGGGTSFGETDTGTVSLKLSAAVASVTLDNFGVRWQTLDAPEFQIRGGSGIGVQYFPEEPVPEPATWAMMIAGFGLVGAAMRRRRIAVVSA